MTIDWVTVQLCILSLITTFNNIQAIVWRSVLLTKETSEKTTDLLQVTDQLYQINFYRVYLSTDRNRTHFRGDQKWFNR
jgi:hypothetical protein